MCDICRKAPCEPRCPNYYDSAIDFIICELCSERIFKGEKYVEINDNPYHLSCVEDIDTEELLEAVGITIEIK